MCHNSEKAYKSLWYKYMGIIRRGLSRLSHTFGRDSIYRKKGIKKEYIYFFIYVVTGQRDNGPLECFKQRKRGCDSKGQA